MREKLMIGILAFVSGVILSLGIAYFSVQSIFINTGFIVTSDGNYYVLSEDQVQNEKDYKSFLLRELDKAHAEIYSLNSSIGEWKKEMDSIHPEDTK